jgi:hypothetical protein
VYLTDICYLWILSTLWEQLTCMNIDHLSAFHRLSGILTQVRGIADVCLGLLIKSSLVVAFPQLVYTWQAYERLVRVWSISFETSVGQVHESRERKHSNQADIWPVYPSTNDWQINHSHKQYGNLFAWLLVQWTVIGTLIKCTSGGNATLRPCGNFVFMLFLIGNPG